jgi:hypothetical protein
MTATIKYFRSLIFTSSLGVNFKAYPYFSHYLQEQENFIMSENQKKILEQQLWIIANTLRGKMDADEFRDYILGFIFYKYLAEKMDLYADSILKPDGIKYKEIDENSGQGKAYIDAIREESLEKLGYFLKPSELFSEEFSKSRFVNAVNSLSVK